MSRGRVWLLLPLFTFTTDTVSFLQQKTKTSHQQQTTKDTHFSKMSIVQKYKKIPQEFQLLITGFIREQHFRKNIPLGISCWITLYVFAVTTEKIMTLHFNVDDTYVKKYSLIYFTRIFNLDRIYRKIRLSLSDLAIDIYPKMNQYRLNQKIFENIKKKNNEPWSYSDIKRPSDGIKFLLHYYKPSTTTALSEGLIEITIFSQKQRYHTNFHKYKRLEFHHDDAHILINLNKQSLTPGTKDLFLTFYDGNINYLSALAYRGDKDRYCIAIEKDDCGNRDAEVSEFYLNLGTSAWRDGLWKHSK